MYDDQYLSTLAIFLKQTLEPNNRKHGKILLLSFINVANIENNCCLSYLLIFCTAENELFKAEDEQKDFPIAVMQLVTRESTEPSVRFAASLFFKNYIRRNWVQVGIIILDA
jgi:hypothetical protein